MVKFRQKMYIAPLAAPLLAKAGTALGSTSLMNAVGVAGLVGQGGSMVQANQQMKQAEQHQQQNAKLQKQQMQVEAQKADAINKLANTPIGQTTQGQAVQQGLFSNTKILKNQKLFARYNMQDIKGFGKDVGNHLWKNKKHIASFLGFGALISGGKYLADKAIQKDKSVMPNQENTQKSYSDVNTSPTKVKSIMSKAKNAAPTLLIGLGMGAIQPISSYISDKAQQKAISKKSEKNFSIRNFYRKGINSIKRSGWNSRQDMNVINKINNSSSSWYDPRSWKWLKKVKHNPVRGAANVYNSLMMMGGETGMQNFRKSLVGKGTSGSKLSNDVANFMDKHGAVSMAGIGALGGTALFKASDLFERGTEKSIKAVDKNAYKYTESKEEEMK